MTNSGGLTELPGMLCPWVTPAWSSPIASVFYFSPQASYASSTTALALGRWPCHLCHREHGGCLLFTPSAWHAPVYPHLFPILHPLSSRPGGRECPAPIEVSRSTGVLDVFLALWNIPPALPLVCSTFTFCCSLLFLPHKNTPYFHLRHKQKQKDLTLLDAYFLLV